MNDSRTCLSSLDLRFSLLGPSEAPTKIQHYNGPFMPSHNQHLLKMLYFCAKEAASTPISLHSLAFVSLQILVIIVARSHLHLQPHSRHLRVPVLKAKWA